MTVALFYDSGTLEVPLVGNCKRTVYLYFFSFNRLLVDKQNTQIGDYIRGPEPFRYSNKIMALERKNCTIGNRCLFIHCACLFARHCLMLAAWLPRLASGKHVRAMNTPLNPTFI